MVEQEGSIMVAYFLMPRERLRIATPIATAIGTETKKKTANQLFPGGFEVDVADMTGGGVALGVGVDVG